jgi:DNA-binding transcriptional ArsR family regulator
VWHHSAERGHQEIPVEPIVRLFRILANRRRIRIVRLLAVMGELPVLSVARATRDSVAQVSAHLGLLASVGFLWRRRSGPRVYYRLAEQPGSPLVASIVDAVRGVFAAIDGSDPRRVARASQADSPTNSDAALFACLTAFTHPRRLQVVRHLERRGSASLAELCLGLSMSPRAAMRHLDKLERRGYLGRRTRGRRTTYCLRDGEGPLQAAAIRAVRERLVDLSE